MTDSRRQTADSLDLSINSGQHRLRVTHPHPIILSSCHLVTFSQEKRS
jgi:hypothetical protein